jgi:CHAT domain-containing protein
MRSVNRLLLNNLVLWSVAAATAAISPAYGQKIRPSLMDSFRVGSGGGALCEAQALSKSPAIKGIFDRAWSLACRDAAQPVGQLFALRGIGLESRVEQARAETISCTASQPAKIEGLRSATVKQCSVDGGGTGYAVYQFTIGDIHYVAQGLTAYDGALRLGLQSIVTDKIVAGKIDIASNGGSNDTTFARAKAAALDPLVALAEGYRRNNSGNYAEAAQFFDSLQQQADERTLPKESDTATQRQARLHEYAINRALQLSNLGEFTQADALFGEAANIPTIDRVQVRLRRNFEAMHLLNQQQLAGAVQILDTPVVPLGAVALTQGRDVDLSLQIVDEVNSASSAASSLGVRQDTKLTPDERATIIDAQALQIRGTILRLQNKPAEARAIFQKAMDDALRIRDGRVTSIARLRAQIMAEMALTDEDQGNFASARGLLESALALLETTYPETNAMNGARARLAAYLVRRGSNEEALVLYRTVISSTVENGASTTGLTNQIRPYFALLTREIPKRPALLDDLFVATQTLIRPGAADSLELLARALQAGQGEAGLLFRQSGTLSRDIERSRIELARLLTLAQQNSAAAPLVAAQQAELKSLISDQATTQAKLAAFPQFRAVSKQALATGTLRAALKPGEAYFKLAVAGDNVYAIYIDQGLSTAYQLAISAHQLDQKVDAIRETIAENVGGKVTTFPFDVETASTLYVDLFGPINDRLSNIKHMIFEPDGAMLRLPPGLLITNRAGVDAYLVRARQNTANEFDFRGIAWLGRTTAISTAVSARSFAEARGAPVSAAARPYLGFGSNAPANAQMLSPQNVAGRSNDCSWPLTTWQRPIAPQELLRAASLVGTGTSSVVTGSQFSDTGIKGRTDLSNYRILHFATHGLVTAPFEGCPARPALLTSFGTGESDGLLTFGEIYNLHLDADLVILSACDTAGSASAVATREIGLTSGGGSALDGLVRAFIGAGGRSVIASHWPAPDDYRATERLVTGLFENRASPSIAEAMRTAEISLMDDADTSHPFYWAGFSIIGDGARRVLSQ